MFWLIFSPAFAQQPAARQTDIVTEVGRPSVIVRGASTVLIGG